MGRPTKLTPEVTDRYCQAVGMGAKLKIAAAYAGIDPDTVNRWLHAGAAAQTGKYWEFYGRVKKAEATAVVGWLAKIEKAASEGTWTAAAWKLERIYPEDYGRQLHELTGKDGGPIEHKVNANINALPTESLVALARGLAEQGGSPESAGEEEAGE